MEASQRRVAPYVGGGAFFVGTVSSGFVAFRFPVLTECSFLACRTLLRTEDGIIRDRRFGMIRRCLFVVTAVLFLEEKEVRKKVRR